MSNYTVEVRGAPTDVESVRTFYTNELTPLLQDYWNKEGRQRYGRDTWEIPPVDFTLIWQQKQLLVLELRNGAGVLVGAALAIKNRALIHRTLHLIVEFLYAPDGEGIEALLTELLKFKSYGSVDDVVVPKHFLGDHFLTYTKDEVRIIY
jgi:hypothetical protein